MRTKLNDEYDIEAKRDKPNAFRCKQYKTAGYYPHFHTLLEIYGVVQGEVLCKVGKDSITLTDGQYIVINPLYLHSFVLEKPAIINYLHIGSNYLVDFTGLYPQCQLPLFLGDIEKNKRIIECIDYIRGTYKNSSELALVGLSNLLISDIIDLYGTEPKQKMTIKIRQSHQYIFSITYTITTRRLSRWIPSLRSFR